MKPMMIVVADSSRARIFTVDSAHSPLFEVETIAHPEARLHERDMVSDLPGKESGKGGAGDHAYQDKIEPKKEEMIIFAKRIADYLEHARNINKLNKLLLIAAPAFLGELRKQLSTATSNKIVFELDKNLVHHDEVDIRKHLSAFIK